MTDSRFPVQGRCQCGQVSYEILEEPDFVIACHCRECQTLSTSVFSLTAFLPESRIRFHGEMKYWERKADSGNISAAKFCPECGNRIYHFNPEAPQVVKLKIGHLSDDSWIAPDAHIWVKEKQAWFQIPEGIPQFEAQPTAPIKRSG